MSYMTYGFGSIDPTSPKGAAKPTYLSLGPTAYPLPHVGTPSAMSLRACFMHCICAIQWVEPPAAATMVGGGAGAAPDCVILSFCEIDPP